jgi:hypothetical protein
MAKSYRLPDVIIELEPRPLEDMEKRLLTAMAYDRRRFEREIANLNRDIEELRRDHDNIAERIVRLDNRDETGGTV